MFLRTQNFALMRACSRSHARVVFAFPHFRILQRLPRLPGRWHWTQAQPTGRTYITESDTTQLYKCRTTLPFYHSILYRYQHKSTPHPLPINLPPPEWFFKVSNKITSRRHSKLKHTSQFTVTQSSTVNLSQGFPTGGQSKLRLL